MQEDVIKLSIYGILIDKEGKVMLQKRANTRYASGWWSLPGGHVESGDSVVKAVVRELHEECGIIVNEDSCDHKLTLVRNTHEGKRYINFFYLINDWDGTPTICDGKASELKFFTSKAFPEQMLPYINEAFKLIEEKIHFFESKY